MKYLIRIKNFIRNRHSNIIKKEISGSDNIITIGDNLYCETLHIIIRGNNNEIKIGKNCRFYGENWIFMRGDNNKLHIGEFVSFDDDVHFILAEGRTINVGNDCMFAKHINIRTSDQHGIYDEHEQRVNIAKDVNIGEHVWICASVLIMKGITIGNGSIVGISSMVIKNVPNNCIVAGHPAKLIKENIHWTRKL